MHQEDHFENVEKIGHYLADYNNADKKVLSLFAYFHDIRRRDDGFDGQHGKRSAQYLKLLYNKNLLDVTDKQFEQLIFACANHSESNAQSNDITIQTCWDADRLDLWRINSKPDPNLLYTEIAKKEETIEYARKLNKK
ncbi:hypothetical protein HOB10_00755 [Candidatus Parcubacteria bacterium]|jgi:uncharacterized protein|nr:hypothetical protein [Candidatus Parcubacteria bacterium]